MNIYEIFLLGIALSMDAFAVAICKGLALNKINFKNMATVGLWFGGFQALMPAIGYLLGMSFIEYIEAVDHWVGFVLLALIGANMIKEALSNDDEQSDCSLKCKTMLIMALATSIDALAVGITLPSFNITNIQSMLVAVGIIGITTFVLSSIGVKIGNIFGTKYKSKAEFAGGAILIILGLKLLLEGLNIL